MGKNYNTTLQLQEVPHSLNIIFEALHSFLKCFFGCAAFGVFQTAHLSRNLEILVRVAGSKRDADCAVASRGAML